MKKLFEAMNALSGNRNGDVVTFDFDQTVVKSFMNETIDGDGGYQFGGINKEIIKRIKTFKSSGKTVFIVTSRQKHLESDDMSVKSLLNRLKIEVDAVFYTDGEPKARKLYELGSTLHYDDDPEEHDAINAFKNLHKDFEITVKYPDELLKDIEAIAKGVILTSDGKIIIAERSDSHEWDAPGGHIMEGEEANYSFWREVKEELGIEVKEVTFLDMLETTWKGVTKDSYYFFGRIDYSSEELEGIINLQWEVSDYFCGDYDEVMRKIGRNSTQNLTNVMKMIESQQEIVESYQPHSKNHKSKKQMYIGMGNSKTTGATGLEKVKDYTRSKSAPVGFGVLEETDEKNKKTYKIKIKSSIKEKKKREYYELSLLDGATQENPEDGGE
jgi:8-oxo-dGTP pyrophosphatase MutT (NUDIX family)